MLRARKITDAITGLGNKHIELLSGVVVAGSVDLAEYTCSVLLSSQDEDDEPMPGVLLSSVTENGNGVILVPADGSNVIIGSIDGPGEHFIVRCSDLVKVVVTIGDTTLVMDGSSIVMNGGGNGGVPITGDVVTRLNNLEQDLNNIKTAFKTWTPVPNDGGSALKGAAAAWFNRSLTETVASDIEDTKVKH